MSKQVRFLDTGLDYQAEFIKDGIVVDSKTIPVVEYDGLEEFVDFSNLPQTYSAQDLIEALDYMMFDTDGEPTNFEEMLYALMKDN